MKKPSLVKVASALYIVILFFSGFLLSIPPANLPVYFILLGLAVVALVFGFKWYRAFGLIAVALSLVLIVNEYRDGLKHKEWMRRVREKISQMHSQTNFPARVPVDNEKF